MRSTLFICLILLSVSIPAFAQDACGQNNRLLPGSIGRVLPGPDNRLRETSSSESELLDTLGGGKAFEVTGEAVCGEGYTWLPISVTTREGFIDGWTVESDTANYFVEPVEGTLIAGYGVTAILPDGIAESAEISLYEKEPETEESGWTLPEYIQINFTGYVDPLEKVAKTDNAITIFRTDLFADQDPDDYNMWEGGFVYNIEEMKPILKERPDLTAFDPIMNRLPLFSIASATNILAHRDYLSFQNGQGYHSVASWGQAIFAPTNTSLEYDYVGLTDDEQYFVLGVFPIDSSALPGEERPAVDLDDPEMDAYLKRNGDFFDALAPETFTPDLTKLDALIASLYIGD